MHKKLIGLFFILFVAQLSCLALVSEGDSLRAVWEDESNPRLERMNALARFHKTMAFQNPDTAIVGAHEILSLVKSDSADVYFMGVAYNILGMSNYVKNNAPKSLEYYRKALKAFTFINHQEKVAATHQMMAITYYQIHDWGKSLEYNQKCLEHYQAIGNVRAQSRVYNNMGLVYLQRDEYDKAIDYFNKGISLLLSLGEDQVDAHLYHNVAIAYEADDSVEVAADRYEKAYQLWKEDSDFFGLLSSYSEYGLFLAKQGELDRSVEMCEKGLEISRDFGQPGNEQRCAECLSLAYEKKGNHQTALEYANRYLFLKDSLDLVEMQADIIRTESMLEYRQKKVQDSLEFSKKAAIQDYQHQMDLEREQQSRYFLWAGLAFLLTIIFFVVHRIRIVGKKNVEIERQKKVVEEQKEEITDSITYARRIQRAILPAESFIHEHFPDSFILYLPKDIVSGDFYWAQKVNDTLLFAVADCTGHGVPGAMVSVVCSNALNRCASELRLTNPADILNRTREMVITSLASGGEQVKDGMDIAICALDLTKKELRFAGANNSLYLVRRNELEKGGLGDFQHVSDEGNTLFEVKGDKQPVGVYGLEQEFSQHIISVLPGDCLYLFSDGYPDQFGGPKGKKFKYKPLKKRFLEISSSQMDVQESQLKTTFYDWKGGLDQIDDVCVVGVRI